MYRLEKMVRFLMGICQNYNKIILTYNLMVLQVLDVKISLFLKMLNVIIQIIKNTNKITQITKGDFI